MAEISVKFEMDENLKKEFDLFCEGVGLNLSSAFSIFAKKAVTEQRIPFDVSIDPFYSGENMLELRRRIAGVESGKSTLKEHELIEV